MMLILLLAFGIQIPGFAEAVSEKDFEVQTTENLISLCTAAPISRATRLARRANKAPFESHEALISRRK
jgi:hypothetical protein